MSSGGSLHGKDYLKLAATLGLVATGAGAAGVGPMAGLLGAGAGGAAASGAGAAAGASGAGLLGAGLGGMGEMAGTVAAQEGALPLSTNLQALGMRAASNPYLPKLLGAASQMANGGQQAQPSMAMQRPQAAPQAPAPLPFGGGSGPYSMAQAAPSAGGLPPEVLAYLEEQRRRQQGAMA